MIINIAINNDIETKFQKKRHAAKEEKMLKLLVSMTLLQSIQTQSILTNESHQVN